MVQRPACPLPTLIRVRDGNYKRVQDRTLFNAKFLLETKDHDLLALHDTYYLQKE